MAQMFFIDHLAQGQESRAAIRSFAAINSWRGRKIEQRILPTTGLPVDRSLNIAQPPVDKRSAPRTKSHSPQKTQASYFTRAHPSILRPSSPLDLCFAEEWTDPFPSYPIGASRSVNDAVDYFIRIFVPSTAAKFYSAGASNLWTTEFWVLALQNAVLFETLVAVCGCSRAVLLEKEKSSTLKLRKDILYHRGNVLRGLSSRLADPDRRTDHVSLLTVHGLITLDAILEVDEPALALHQIGLNAIVKMRGGLKDIGFQGLTNSLMLSLESLCPNFKLTMEQNEEVLTDVSEPAEPAVHVVEEHHTVEKASSMMGGPLGFRDLALAQRLSRSNLRCLTSLSNYVCDPEAREEDKILAPYNSLHTEDILEYLTAQDRAEEWPFTLPNTHEWSDFPAVSRAQNRLSEKFVVLGLLLYVIETQPGLLVSRMLENALNGLIEAFCAYVGRHTSSIYKEDLMWESGALLWVAFIVASSTSWCVHLAQEARQAVLTQLMGPYRYSGDFQSTKYRRFLVDDWEEVEQVLSRFYWNMESMAAWKSCWQATQTPA